MAAFRFDRLELWAAFRESTGEDMRIEMLHRRMRVLFVPVARGPVGHIAESYCLDYLELWLEAAGRWLEAR